MAATMPTKRDHFLGDVIELAKDAIGRLPSDKPAIPISGNSIRNPGNSQPLGV